MKRSDIKMHFM